MTILGSGDKHTEIVADPLLSAVLVERCGAKAPIDIKVVDRELARHRTWATMGVAFAGNATKEIFLLCLPRHRLPPSLLSAN
jgi:hypothetical protein